MSNPTTTGETWIMFKSYLTGELTPSPPSHSYIQIRVREVHGNPDNASSTLNSTDKPAERNIANERDQLAIAVEEWKQKYRDEQEAGKSEAVKRIVLRQQLAAEQKISRKWEQNANGWCNKWKQLRDQLATTVGFLKKYQARYHGAEHAQKFWQEVNEWLAKIGGKDAGSDTERDPGRAA